MIYDDLGLVLLILTKQLFKQCCTSVAEDDMLILVAELQNRVTEDEIRFKLVKFNTSTKFNKFN